MCGSATDLENWLSGGQTINERCAGSQESRVVGGGEKSTGNH